MKKISYNQKLDNGKVRLMNEIQRLRELLKAERSSSNKIGRKEQVLSILKNATQPMSIAQIAKEINISTKNVSSQLTYLKSDGHSIISDSNGKKVLSTRLDLLK